MCKAHGRKIADRGYLIWGLRMGMIVKALAGATALQGGLRPHRQLTMVVTNVGWPGAARPGIN